MNTSQRSALMGYWWPDACTAMHWDSTDRALRLRVLSQAVGRELASASDLKTQTDWDRVKAHLLSLSQPANINDQVAIANQPRTRLLHSIRQLGKQFINPSIHQSTNPYIMAICQDRFGLGRSTAEEPWENLTLSQLEQLRNTLTHRARAKQKKAMSISSPTNEADKMDMPGETTLPLCPAALSHCDNDPF